MLILAVIVSIAMDNRERILGKVRVLNKRYLNPCTLNIAGRLNSPYAMLRQVGRRSGSVYTTPIVADFAQSWDGFVIPLPYGVNTDCCRNVMAAGRCTITKDQVVYNVMEPTIVDTAMAFPELPAVLDTSLVTSHTSTAFTFSMRCIILFSASQRHRAWDICSEKSTLKAIYWSHSA